MRHLPPSKVAIEQEKMQLAEQLAKRGMVVIFLCMLVMWFFAAVLATYFSPMVREVIPQHRTIFGLGLLFAAYTSTDSLVDTRRKRYVENYDLPQLQLLCCDSKENFFWVARLTTFTFLAVCVVIVFIGNLAPANGPLPSPAPALPPQDTLGQRPQLERALLTPRPQSDLEQAIMRPQAPTQPAASEQSVLAARYQAFEFEQQQSRIAFTTLGSNGGPEVYYKNGSVAHLFRGEMPPELARWESVHNEMMALQRGLPGSGLQPLDQGAPPQSSGTPVVVSNRTNGTPAGAADRYTKYAPPADGPNPFDKYLPAAGAPNPFAKYVEPGAQGTADVQRTSR